MYSELTQTLAVRGSEALTTVGDLGLAVMRCSVVFGLDRRPVDTPVRPRYSCQCRRGSSE
jgi:hypothetical protein